MNSVYNINASKKATNVTINSDLLKKARHYKINISKTIEQELVRIIKEYQEQEWLEENKKAIEGQNERIEKFGSFSDGLRRF